jgi:hypothetical protein
VRVVQLPQVLVMLSLLVVPVVQAHPLVRLGVVVDVLMLVVLEVMVV